MSIKEFYLENYPTDELGIEIDPKATLKWLKEFNEDFYKNRGDDAEYKFAQLLRSSARDAEKYQLDASLHTGWGVIPFNNECWEEFEYTLHLNSGEVTYKLM